jgi:23S rRNA (guanine2445-N2)-methyltransferase
MAGEPDLSVIEGNMHSPGILAKSSRIVVTCAKRLAPYVQQEIAALGLTPDHVFPTSVVLRGTFKDCVRLNLNLRCASQVLFSLKEFPADHPDRVYATLVALPWEEVVPSDGYLSVTSTVNHPTVNNNLFMNLRVKDAVTDRIRNKTGVRPDSGPELDGAVIHLFWQESRAEIFLDTSGETLAKHGYRKMPGRAPMMESLAAATLLASQWDRASPFVNPMCGSGTVAIEAALLATDRRPGLLRDNYAFLHVRGFDRAIYQKERKRLGEKVRSVPGLSIIATDISEESIRIAKANAAVAGIQNLIQFSVGDFEKTPIPEKPGVIYFNPEYGERLGQMAELEATYARIGDFMKKKAQGYKGYIFTGNLGLAKKVGLKASRRIEFYTGKIDCRLLEYELYAGTKREF